MVFLLNGVFATAWVPQSRKLGTKAVAITVWCKIFGSCRVDAVGTASGTSQQLACARKISE
eukprot:6182163-Pleurochrysis_carterae.AAC.2